MKQTKWNSLIETISSVGIGFLINLGLSFIILPTVGIESTFLSNLGMVLSFTGTALARTYFVRRWFENR